MTKASSPVRLEKGLMAAATLTGKQQHRSAVEQVEYWASLGRFVSKTLTPDNLLNILAGLAKLNIEPISTPSIDPNQVFANLERERNNGVLAISVTGSSVRYQASTTHPGLLEEISADGTIIKLGHFSNGVFIDAEITK